MRIKNTNRKPVVLSVDLGLSLAPGEVIDVGKREFAKGTLKIKGVEKTKEKVGAKVPKKKK